MASYPGAKVHRRNRRKLGRGQFTAVSAAVPNVTNDGATVFINWTVPVVVRGNLDIHLSAGRTLLTQDVDAAGNITQTYSESVAGLSWAILTGDPIVRSRHGGPISGGTGTFPE